MGLSRYFPDIVKWIDDAYCIARRGSGVKITWASGGGFYGARVEGILRKYGVRVYARQYAFSKDEDLGVTVRQQQAVFADWLLRRAGVPVTSTALTNATEGEMPLAWGTGAPATGASGVMADLLFGIAPTYTKEERLKRERRDQERRRRRVKRRK